MLPCIGLTKVDGTFYSQPVNDIRHIFEMPTYVVIIRITNRISELVTESFDDVVTAANLDLVPFQDAAMNNRRTAVNRAYVNRVAKVKDGQAIIVLKTEQSFYPVESFDTLSPIFAQVSGGGGGTVTGDNLGGGVEVFKDKVGSVLNFKTLVAGSGFTLTPGTNIITLDSTASGELSRASLVTDGLSVILTFTGSTDPVLTKVGAGDYRLTIPTTEKITAIRIAGTNAHQTGTGTFKLRITDTDGHYYHLASSFIWSRTTNQPLDSQGGGVIPQWSNTAAGERTFEWQNVQLYGAAGFEIVSVCV